MNFKDFSRPNQEIKDSSRTLTEFKATTKIQDQDSRLYEPWFISPAQIYDPSSFNVNKFQKNQTYCFPNCILPSTHPWKATGEQITKISTKCHPLWFCPFMATGLLQSIRKACLRPFMLMLKNNPPWSKHSLWKHLFLLALRRWGRFAWRNICDSMTEIPYWWRKICPESGQKRWLVDWVVTLF